MKRILVLLVFVIVLVIGFVFYTSGLFPSTKNDLPKSEEFKKPLLRVALVADSENENELLGKALLQAQGMGVNLVIGLGDWSQVGSISELEEAKKVFDQSRLSYFLVPGDHDLWDSRNRGEDALDNYRKVFGKPSQEFTRNGIQFVLLDNSDIYKGISQEDWEILNSKLEARNSKLTFVFSHKTPFHPESDHVMGEDSEGVRRQAENLMQLLESKGVDGLFTGDLHFFARFKSPNGSVRITTIGAASAERNFQGPRFAVLTIFDTYSWEVEDIEIR